MKRCFFILLTIIIIITPVAVLGASNVYELSSSGEYVVKIQNRLFELGYIRFRATGYFGDMTYNGVMEFQKQNDLPITGVINAESNSLLFSSSAKRAPMNKNFRRVSGPALQYTNNQYGQAVNWETVNSIFSIGKTAVITDFNTKKQFTVTRTGGNNHAHVETVSEKDTSVFLSVFGNDYTWEKRGVLVSVDGNTYAASLFGYPNSSDSIPNNNMNGSLCLYFSGSTSDIGISDAEHQQKISTVSSK